MSDGAASRVATRRLPLLLTAALILLSGLWAGLVRMGWGLSGDAATLSAVTAR